jgi:PPOX class probable F420-dependent enzyme
MATGTAKQVSAPPPIVTRATVPPLRRSCCADPPAEGNPIMAEIPAAFADLLQQKKAFAHIATVMPDGSPQVTPVWFDFANGHVRVNTAKGRVKARNLREGSRVALSILDPDNPYRYMQIRGRVAQMREQGAGEHIDLLAHKYLGKDKYPFAQPGEVRVMYEIEPLAVQTMG